MNHNYFSVSSSSSTVYVEAEVSGTGGITQIGAGGLIMGYAASGITDGVNTFSLEQWRYYGSRPIVHEYKWTARHWHINSS